VPYIPQAWLSKKWEQLHNAPVVDIRKIRQNPHDAIDYILKYITKGFKDTDAMAWFWFLRKRQYTTSLGLMQEVRFALVYLFPRRGLDNSKADGVYFVILGIHDDVEYTGKGPPVWLTPKEAANLIDNLSNKSQTREKLLRMLFVKSSIGEPEGLRGSNFKL
jgi:hypothetical protein